EGDSSSVYVQMMRSFQEKGMLRSDVKPEYLAMFFDNLLMMLQFSSCTYYDERWRLYCKETDKKELAAQMVRMLAVFFREPDGEKSSGDADPGLSEKKNGLPDKRPCGDETEI
ncbi:MAG: hypothetical protein ACFNYI_03705, partial [Eubacterium sp.]